MGFWARGWTGPQEGTGFVAGGFLLDSGLLLKPRHMRLTAIDALDSEMGHLGQVTVLWSRGTRRRFCRESPLCPCMDGLPKGIGSQVHPVSSKSGRPQPLG